MKVRTLTLAILALSAVGAICLGCRTANSDNPRHLHVEAERHRQKAKDLLLNHRLDEGLSSFREAILLDPNEAWPYQFVFDVCRDSKLNDRAISIFQDATQVKPDNALAYDYLGAAYCSVSRYEEAIAAYQEVVKISPEDEEAHYTLGSLYMIVGDRGEALKKYNDLRELEAGSWIFSREREKYARRAGQLLECIETGNIVLFRGRGCTSD